VVVGRVSSSGETRGQLYARLGAAGGGFLAAAAFLGGLTGGIGHLAMVHFTGTIVVLIGEVVTFVGLGVYRGRPRLGSRLVLVAAGLTLGMTAVALGQERLIGLAWLPGGILLTLGAHTLWTEAGGAQLPTPPRSGEGSEHVS
jgi:hypothetical protein